MKGIILAFLLGFFVAAVMGFIYHIKNRKGN